MKKYMKNSSTKKLHKQKDRLVFIDWDGTICYDRLWKSMRTEESPLYEQGKKIDQLLFGKNKKLVKQWMKGKYSSEYINEYLSTKLDISYKQLWLTFKQDSKAMKINEEIAPLLLELKKTSYVCLITGNMDSFSRFTARSQKLDRYFDVIVNSYDRKKLKTEYNGSEFKKIAKEFNVPIKKSFLLDDSQKVCDVFEKVGGTPFRVKTKDDSVFHLKNLTQAANNGQEVSKVLSIRQFA